MGASVVMQDDDVSSRTFIAQCMMELVQCLDITSSSDDLPRFQELGQNQHLCIPEDCPSPSQLMALSLLSSLMENANGTVPNSAVSFQIRNGETSFRHLSQYGAKNHRLRVDTSAAVLRSWLFTDLCGLRSVSTGPKEHKLSYSLSFQSSPVLHCALIQVFGLLCPQSHACRLE